MQQKKPRIDASRSKSNAANNATESKQESKSIQIDVRRPVHAFVCDSFRNILQHEFIARSIDNRMYALTFRRILERLNWEKAEELHQETFVPVATVLETKSSNLMSATGIFGYNWKDPDWKTKKPFIPMLHSFQNLRTNIFTKSETQQFVKMTVKRLDRVVEVDRYSRHLNRISKTDNPKSVKDFIWRHEKHNTQAMATMLNAERKRLMLPEKIIPSTNPDRMPRLCETIELPRSLMLHIFSYLSLNTALCYVAGYNRAWAAYVYLAGPKLRTPHVFIRHDCERNWKQLFEFWTRCGYIFEFTSMAWTGTPPESLTNVTPDMLSLFPEEDHLVVSPVNQKWTKRLRLELIYKAKDTDFVPPESLAKQVSELVIAQTADAHWSVIRYFNCLDRLTICMDGITPHHDQWILSATWNTMYTEFHRYGMGIRAPVVRVSRVRPTSTSLGSISRQPAQEKIPDYIIQVVKEKTSASVLLFTLHEPNSLREFEVIHQVTLRS